MGFESWLERDQVMALDFDAAVVGIASQPFWLRWTDAAGDPMSHAPQITRFEPCVDSFGDISPPGFEQHVVAHVGQEFGFGAICTCRCAHFVRCDAPSDSAPKTSSGAVTRSGLSRLGNTVSRRAFELSS